MVKSTQTPTAKGATSSTFTGAKKQERPPCSEVLSTQQGLVQAESLSNGEIRCCSDIRDLERAAHASL